MKINKLASNLISGIDSYGNTYWYSYETMIAFQGKGQKLLICENTWSQTTGKHLNMIDPDKSIRVSREFFKNAIAQYLGNSGFDMNQV